MGKRRNLTLAKGSNDQSKRKSKVNNSYSFAAIRGVQAGRAFYVIMVPLRVVPRMFRFDQEELPTELRAQRDLNKSRVPVIARYITEHPDEYILSALSASVDGAMTFETADGRSRSVGVLTVPMSATIVLNDGQHRRAAIAEALLERPHLGDETIAVTVFPDEGLARSQQMFVDLNQHSVKPARSLRLCYDGRDDGAKLTKAVTGAVPLLRDMTDFARSNLPAKSRKLFSFSNLHQATKTVVQEACLYATADDPDEVVAFWEGVIENMPDWERAGRREVATSELRRDCIHAHGIALEAIAKAGARLILSYPDDWRGRLSGLRCVDWSRANSGLWEGRALVGGRINRSRTNVLLTAEVISRALQAKDGPPGTN
jgi:DNA sulfur modification protein DndB